LKAVDPGFERQRLPLSYLIEKVLRPVIGILLRSGVPFGLFTRAARRIYVDIASTEFGLEGRKTNTSRVAMLTGLTRVKVKEELDSFRLDEDSDTDDLDKVRHASRMLLGWFTDEKFTDSSGSPRALPLKGKSPSFEELYDQYSGKGVPLTSMLRELISVGAIEELSDDLLVARSRSYTPKASDPQSLGRICQGINDHATTASFNLYRDPGQRARFERFATNQLVPASKEEEFRNFLESEGQAYLEKVDDWLTSCEGTATEGEQYIRLGTGVYQVRSEPIESRNNVTTTQNKTNSN